MNVLNLEECELLGDSKYRAYISQVEKALKAFEYTSEWADLISALGKLNKVLSTHIKYPVIPKRVTIGKRLAQCLHPALPSGVHLKVLETYDIIFKCIGTTRLASDLFTYSAGLFPLMGYAAMNVRPVLLQLYETHFVSLQKHIKPALTGLIMGLLPGLEEGSEHCERTCQLLEDFCEGAEKPFFYGCLWECVLASSSNRLAGINFVLLHFNRKQSMEDQIYFMGTNLDVLVCALSQSVQDSSVLVQRSALDVLVCCFPIHNSQLPRSDMILLLTSAIKVVLRRDMSLNRRLYAWLMGTDSNGLPILTTAAHTTSSVENGMPSTVERQDSTLSSLNVGEFKLDYFNNYSKELLITAIKNSMREDMNADGTDVSDGKLINLKPFKVLMSILDKPEIGSVILDDILVEIFRCMYRECVTKMETGPNKSRDRRTSAAFNSKYDDKSTTMIEIVKTANLLFGTFEPSFIWQFIGQLFEKACDNIPSDPNRAASLSSNCSDELSLVELCSIVDFLLDKLSVEAYVETQTEHFPNLLHRMTVTLTEKIDKISDSELILCLKLCSKILSRVQPSVNIVSDPDDQNDLSSTVQSKPSSNTEVNVPNEKSQTERVETFPTVAVRDDEGFTILSYDSLEESESKLAPASKVDQPPFEPHFGAKFDQGSGVDSNFKGAQAKSSDDTFCEFVQFVSEEKEDENARRDSEIERSSTLLQACIKSYVQLFESIISSRVIQDSVLPTLVMKYLNRKPMSAVSRQELQRFIRQGLGSRNNSESEDGQKSTAKSSAFAKTTSSKVSLQLAAPTSKRDMQLPTAALEAFGCSCQLLIEFSALPIFCSNNTRTAGTVHETLKTVPNDDVVFPKWLQLLLSCACAVDNFSAESTSISTILDLIGLTQSSMAEAESKDHAARSSETVGTVSVLIHPILTSAHLTYINENTCFYKLVASNLWEYLSEEHSECHLRLVDLIYQLHQLSTDPWTCEDVISASLLSDDKAIKFSAHNKFAAFWHLLRERSGALSIGSTVRTFDRSLLVMLDSLQSESHVFSSLTQTWLLHCIQRGDFIRVIEPVLMILLHPDTARVSVQHVNIHKPKRVRIAGSDCTDDSSEHAAAIETNIFAISSESGNVIYHINNNGKPFSKKMTEDFQSYALSFISDKGSSTQTSRVNLEAELHFDKVNPSDINLRVNPFGSVNSLDSDTANNESHPSKQIPESLQNAKRLNKETCEKERIFFDDNEQEGENGSPNEEEICAKDVADWIIDDLLNTVVKVLDDKQQNSIYNEGINGEGMNGNGMNGEGMNGEGMNGENMNGEGMNGEAISGSPMRSGCFVDSEYCRMSDIDSESGAESEMSSHGRQREETLPKVHPLHTHILLYTQKYDANRTLYALTCLKGLISASPRLVTCSLTTSNIGSSNSPHITQLLNLLIRHRRSVLGKNFHSDLSSDLFVGVRSSMFVEVIIALSLYFIRSYFPNLMMSKLSDLELNANKEIQITSCDVLTLVFSELIGIAQSSGRGVATYIGELLSKCKVQKTLLYSILANVHNSRQRANRQEDETIDISEAIINFNNENMDSETNETFQVKLLRLLLSVVQLEDQIRRSRAEQLTMALPREYEKLDMSSQFVVSSVLFINGQPIVYQTMFLLAIVNMLRQQHMCHLHQHWISAVISLMPYLCRALTKVSLATVYQICCNLDILAQLYQAGHSSKTLTCQPDKIPPDHLITVLEGLTTICHYCLLDMTQQDCSIDNSINVDGPGNSRGGSGGQGLLFGLANAFHMSSNSREASPSMKDNNTVTVNVRSEARSQLLNILPNIFASLAILWKAIHVSETKKQSGEAQPWWTLGSPKMIRQCILDFITPIAINHAQHTLAAVAVVWNERRRKRSSNNRRVVPVPCEDQLILVNMISAVKLLSFDTIMHMVRQIIKQPTPTSATAAGKPRRIPLEVGLLQFLFSYIQRINGSVLVESWSLLLSLFKEGLQMSIVPPGLFLLISILNEVLQKIPMFEDRKDQKDLQEITQKLLEACSEIAGSSLEQTNFFRRNLAVKPGPQLDLNAEDELNLTDGETEGMGSVGEMPQSASHTTSAATVASQHPHQLVAMHSVQALLLLSDVTATLLDVVYRSEEKEKVVPLLNNILYNVFPYLKDHRTTLSGFPSLLRKYYNCQLFLFTARLHNLPSFRACSQLLSSLSSYQYTRKAWKKEAFDLMLDGNFFQMDEQCIKPWMTIIDNLMTHDRTSFRDLITRVNVTQGSSLNLFTSREAEFELRSQLLKRLSFTIFCSEIDQYHKYMPDIQEKLADCLRLPSVLSLQAQVFLCFRVLILRISSQYLTSLWPTIITELVQVMLQLEQTLMLSDNDTPNSRTSNLSKASNLDPSWVLGTGSTNNLANHSTPGSIQLFLSACKLLDLALTLPTDFLPQFQLYRWAFVGDPGGSTFPSDSDKRRLRDQPPSFVPHVVRIAKLMMAKFDNIPLLPRTSQRPLLTVPRISSMVELASFFMTVYRSVEDNGVVTSMSKTSKINSALNSNPTVVSPPIPRSQSAPDFKLLNAASKDSSVVNDLSPNDIFPRSPLQSIELIILRDFLEPIPNK